MRAVAELSFFIAFQRRPLTAMDSDRKYRQNGYMDSERDNSHREQPNKPKGPRPPIDVTGPRLPRMVQSVTASRCWNCATTLPSDIDFKGACPKCNSPLHCCKQCTNFESSTRFQCLRPIPVRIAYKDQTNECELFQPRVTVARDAASHNGSSANGYVAPKIQEPRNSTDARTAFDNLFKK